MLINPPLGSKEDYVLQLESGRFTFDAEKSAYAFFFGYAAARDGHISPRLYSRKSRFKLTVLEPFDRRRHGWFQGFLWAAANYCLRDRGHAFALGDGQRVYTDDEEVKAQFERGFAAGTSRYLRPRTTMTYLRPRNPWQYD